MKKQFTYRFGKLLRKYRHVQKRLFETDDQNLIKHLRRKLELLGKRLVRFNRRWKMGIAMTALLVWMGGSTQAQTFPANSSFSSLNGTNGFIIEGNAEDLYSGFSVSGIGDINGDGVDDAIVGAIGLDRISGTDTTQSAGGAYVIFGDTAGFASPLNIGSLDGTNGFTIVGGDEYGFAGVSVSGAGDFNGDGIDDLLIGASGASPDTSRYAAGRAFVVFGNNSGFSDTLGLETLDGTNGFAINGEGRYSDFGNAVSNAGDLNGDGIHDMIIGARYAMVDTLDEAGKAYVIFGSNAGFTSPMELSSLNGANGFSIIGASENAYTGRSVSGAGDVNGDGIDDVIVGAPYAQIDTAYSGGAYVVFGSNAGFSDSLDLSDIDGTNGFIISGSEYGDYAGWGVSGAGDFNNDGIDDILFGAPGAGGDSTNDFTGKTYVIFGSNTGFANPFVASSVDGTNGFVIAGLAEDDYCGFAVSGVGDVNGDGIDDIATTAPGVKLDTMDLAGEIYVIFGSDSVFANGFSLSNLDGNNGFAMKGISGYDYTGISINSAGDLNGDGAPDIIVGGYGAERNGLDAIGESYVIFGMPDTSTNTSINDLIPNLPMTVAPNPTRDILHISSETFIQADQVNISLYDMQGREMRIPQMRESMDKYQLDMASLPKGVYLLRVASAGQVASKRIIKR